MSRKPAKSKPEAAAARAPRRYELDDTAAWGGFVNIRLNDDASLSFNEWWRENELEVHSYVDDLLGEGMKVAVSYDAENQCYICTFTGRLCASADDRYCMTTRAGTFAESLALSVWKHFAVAQGNYDDFMPRTGKFATWG